MDKTSIFIYLSIYLLLVWTSYRVMPEPLALRGGFGGWRGGWVIVVRVCEPVFRSLPHSYAWPLKKNGPIHILGRLNVDPIIYCPLIFFIRIDCWQLDKYRSQFIEYQEN